MSIKNNTVRWGVQIATTAIASPGTDSSIGDQVYKSYQKSLFLKNPKQDLRRLTDVKDRAHGTSEWFLQQQHYQSWLHEENSRVLLITGAAGIGKTTIATFLIQQLERKRKLYREKGNNVALAYFFCSHGDERNNSMKAVLRGLLWQLLDTEPSLFDYIKSKDLDEQASFTEESLLFTLTEIIEDSHIMIYLLVDGLDECQNNEGHAILKNLSKFAANDSAKVKIILISRPQQDKFKHVTQLDINSDMIKKDISTFVHKRAEEIFNRFAGGPYERQLQKRMVHTICKGAGDISLWAALVLNEFNQLKDANKIEARLEELQRDLPRGLNEVYDRMLHWLDPVHEKEAKFVLLLLTVARQPLTKNDIMTAYALHIAQNPKEVDDLSRPINISIFCGSLISIKGEVVSFVHHSAREYLESNYLRNHYAPQRVFSRRPTKACAVVLIAMSSLAALLRISLSLKTIANFRDSCIVIILLQYTPLIPYWRAQLCALFNNETAEVLNKSLLHRRYLITPVFRAFNSMGITTSLSKYHVDADEANFLVFQICWKYLNLREFQKQRTQITSVLRKRSVRRLFKRQDFEANSFLKYAIDECIEHALTANKNSIRRFLQSQAICGRGLPLGDWWLHSAAWSGRPDLISHLIDCGADVNTYDIEGKMPLHWAAWNGHLEVSKKLLDMGALADPQDNNRRTPLHYASVQGWVEVMNLLIDAKVNLDTQDMYGATPLHWASAKGHARAVSFLLHQNAGLNAKDQWGGTPLAWAIENENLEIIGKLLANDAEVDYSYNYVSSIAVVAMIFHVVVSKAQELCHTVLQEIYIPSICITTSMDYGSRRSSIALNTNIEPEHPTSHAAILDNKILPVNTGPLIRAIQKRNPDIVRLLINTGRVDINSRDEMTKATPLLQAIEDGNEVIVTLLLDHPDIEVNLQDKDGKTALWLATEKGQEVLVRVLLSEDSIDPNIQDKNGVTPLMLAVINGKLTIAQLLLNSDNVSINAQADSIRHSGRTALSFASSRGCDSIVEMLLNHSEIDPDLKDDSGRAPLFWAVENGCARVVEMLLSHEKVNPELENGLGYSPLQCARVNKRRDIEQLLIDRLGLHGPNEA